VTVLAPTAAEADALSTAFTLLGPQATANYLEQRPDVAALFVGRRARVEAYNLTDADYTPRARRRGRTPSSPQQWPDDLRLMGSHIPGIQADTGPLKSEIPPI